MEVINGSLMHVLWLIQCRNLPNIFTPLENELLLPYNGLVYISGLKHSIFFWFGA